MIGITKQISKYNYSSRSGNIVKYMVLHYTGNKNDTALNNAKYFSVGRSASAHYFVDDKQVVQIVEDSNASWHCGDGKGKYGITNQNSIGIEMCGTDGGYISTKTVKNTMDLVKYLMKKYNINLDKVVRHYDASRKNCPSAFSLNNWSRWNDFKKRLESSEKLIDKIEDKKKEFDIQDSIKTSACKESPIASQMIEEIKLLQGIVGLDKDGIGTAKLAKLLPELKGHEQRGCVTIMQRILILKGMLSKGSATGVIGPSNVNAINRFKLGVGMLEGNILIDFLTWFKLIEY